MEIFTRFNRKNIQDRQIDTLIGLSKGLLADGKIDQAEAEFLYTWLIQNKQQSDNPIINNLLERVHQFLADGKLDNDEAAELFTILRTIAGESSEIGELAKPTKLPLTTPEPVIDFNGRMFVFTGTCAFGTRRECEDVTESLGGTCLKRITKKLHYLVLGTYVTDSWAHENYGRKIEKAVEYQREGTPIFIVTEEHWARSGNLFIP